MLGRALLASALLLLTLGAFLYWHSLPGEDVPTPLGVGSAVPLFDEPDRDATVDIVLDASSGRTTLRAGVSNPENANGGVGYVVIFSGPPTGGGGVVGASPSEPGGHVATVLSPEQFVLAELRPNSLSLRMPGANGALLPGYDGSRKVAASGTAAGPGNNIGGPRAQIVADLRGFDVRSDEISRGTLFGVANPSSVVVRSGNGRSSRSFPVGSLRLANGRLVYPARSLSVRTRVLTPSVQVLATSPAAETVGSLQWTESAPTQASWITEDRAIKDRKAAEVFFAGVVLGAAFGFLATALDKLVTGRSG